jgi:hypothetical protein
MKFLDIQTGYSFDGLWTDSQSNGYIFWFPNEQSINISYSMPICIITETEDPLNLCFEKNEIYSFISHLEKKTTIDGFEFDTPVYSDSITTIPEKISDNCFIHIINVACNCKQEGEFICKIYIDDKGFIKIGADFYGEYEPSKINLANNGVEIPDAIQKAIYDSNVHEDYVDNILLNRKYKELLSNFWDIVANKGSYKSLENSLDWFEWGNIINIREIWKRNEGSYTMFDDRKVVSILKEKIRDHFENAIKTTYVSLYCSRYTERDEYDIENNPIIEELSMKWALSDMKLKMALLAQFFGTFFLPIHLSILHATVEDKIFTNTIKSVVGTHISRNDCFGDFTYIESNVKDGDIFKLDNVRVCASKNTSFYHPNRFGVDAFPKDEIIDDINVFANQYYTGPGVVIPIELTINNQENRDFIKQTVVSYDDNNLVFYKKHIVRKNKIELSFNFLAIEAKEYNIRMMFILGSGKTLTKHVIFKVEDIDNVSISIYKVQAKDDKNGFTYSDFANMENSKYFFSIQEDYLNSNDEKYYLQFLPYMHPENPKYINYNGIKLNRTVVIKLCKPSKYDLVNIRFWFRNYLEFQRKNEDGKLKYLIFVSKQFNEPFPVHMKDHPEYKVIRNDMVFYPQFHNMVKMSGNKESDFTVSQFDAVCCAPEIHIDDKTSKPFKYGKQIASSEWTFTNASNRDIVIHPSSSRQPFVVKNDGLIKPGYYDISFKYSLASGIEGICKLDSAFRIKLI